MSSLQKVEKNKTVPITVYDFCAYIFLFISWFVIFMMIAAVTEGGLAPWDTTRFRPPLGAWERTLNDFFEGGLGARLGGFVFGMLPLSS